MTHTVQQYDATERNTSAIDDVSKVGRRSNQTVREKEFESGQYRGNKDRSTDKHADDSRERGGARPRNRFRNAPLMVQGADYFTGDSGSGNKEKGKKGGRKIDKVAVKTEASNNDDKVKISVEDNQEFQESELEPTEYTGNRTSQSMKTESPEPKVTKVQMVSDSEDSSDEEESDDFIDNDDDDEYLERAYENSRYVPVTIPYQNVRHVNVSVENALFNSGSSDIDDAPVKTRGTSNFRQCEHESFLLQLPSNLKIRENEVKEIYNVDYEDVNVDMTREEGINVSSVGDMNEGGTRKENTIKASIPPGKIGKLQQYRSGKCYLVTNDGKRYVINSGMPVNFSQYLAKITSNASSNSVAEQTSSSFVKVETESSNEHVFIKQETKNQRTEVGKNNDLYFISKINTKLIVTPDFDIGEKTPRTSSEPDVIRSTYMHSGDLAASEGVPSSAVTVGSTTASAPTKKEREKQKDSYTKKEKYQVSPGVETAAEVLASFSVVGNDAVSSEPDPLKNTGGGMMKRKGKTTSSSSSAYKGKSK